jgi:hypothetical protein
MKWTFCCFRLSERSSPLLELKKLQISYKFKLVLLNCVELLTHPKALNTMRHKTANYVYVTNKGLLMYTYNRPKFELLL